MEVTVKKVEITYAINLYISRNSCLGICSWPPIAAKSIAVIACYRGNNPRSVHLTDTVIAPVCNQQIAYWIQNRPVGLANVRGERRPAIAKKQ